MCAVCFVLCKGQDVKAAGPINNLNNYTCALPAMLSKCQNVGCIKGRHIIGHLRVKRNNHDILYYHLIH